MANSAFVTVTNGMVEARPCQGQGERAREKSLVCLFVCLVGWFGLVINYNVAYDRINVMATINVRQRINVHTMGTSRPSLAGQCPPIKKGPDPIPYPHRHPPKTTDKSLRKPRKFQFRTLKIEKRP